MSEYQYVEHEFAPVYNAESQVLVLGSLPSVKSREQGFYYGHPRNRFWKVVAAVLGIPEPLSIEEKKRMLLAGHVAVYDVVRACEIIGSSDSSIRNVIPADIESIVTHAPIQAVFTNGKTAGRLYKKYQAEHIDLPMIELPSTSPANAAFSLERLEEIWKQELGRYL